MWLCASSLSRLQYGWGALIIFLVRTDGRYLLSDSGYRHVGCERLTGGTYTRNMGANDQCQSASRRCQPCFILDTSYNPVHLTLTNCIQNNFASKTGTSVVPDYKFINVDRHGASVTVGLFTYLLPMGGQRGSTAECSCLSKYGAEVLSCDTSVNSVSYIRAYNALHVMDECATVNVASVSLNMGDNDCNNMFCPTCFRLDTSSNEVALTIEDCGNWQKIDLSSNAVIQYVFQNTGSNAATVSDETQMYKLSPYGGGASSTNCVCFGSSLSCDVPSVKAAAGSEYIAKFPASMMVTGPLYMDSSSNYYLRYDSSAIEFIAGASNRVLSLATTSTLHGTWQADGLITTSDARLKKDIRPLHETLRAFQSTSPLTDNQSADSLPEAVQADPAQWALSKLKPVSYRYTSQEDSGQRFGFIADDVEQVLPDMVRIGEDDARTKRLLLLDFIALLVSALQGQQQVLADLSKQGEERHVAASQRFFALEQHMDRVEKEVGRLSNRMNSCATTCTT